MGNAICTTGSILAASSNEATVTSSQCSNSHVSGVPQFSQKPRLPMFEEAKIFRSPRVQVILS